MTMQRLLLRRRRWDISFLACGFALLPLMIPAGKLVFGAFMVTGLYLALARHKVRRDVPWRFSLVLAAYVVWTIGLSVLRGEPFDNNRNLSYALLEGAFLFMPLGLCLLAKPIDAMVFGARVAVVAITILASIQFFGFGERVGLGGNEAIFGFLAAMTGLITRLPTASSPLPDSRVYFYVSLLPVLLSETRAAWLVYVVAMIFDLFGVKLRSRSANRRPQLRFGLGLVIAAALAVPAATIVQDRFSVGLAEYERFQASGDAVGSVDVRLAIWVGAAKVLGEHPAIGVGGMERQRAVADAARSSPANAELILTYRHLHNLFLDEALSSGLIGLGLLIAVFATFLSTVFIRTRSGRIRQTAVLVVFLVVSFGSFHGVLLNEWMIMELFGFMAVLLTSLKRHRPVQRVRSLPIAKPSQRRITDLGTG